MDIKKCTGCGEEKSIMEFYKKSGSSVARHSRCKECEKKRSAKYKSDNREKVMESDRARSRRTENRERLAAYYKTERGKKTHRSTCEKWRKNNAIKIKAHRKLQYAVKSGKIIKGRCAVCFSDRDIHGHHEDYSKPLDVIWLCAKHHSDHQWGKLSS